MSYIKRWGDGWDFNNLQRAVGLKGIKPLLDHAGDSIGLGGFNDMGKAHGTNAMGGALIFGGSQLMSGMGGMGGSGGGSSLTGGLLDFSGGQAAAPIVDMSSPATASSLQGLNTSAGAGGSGGMLSSLSQGLDVANKTGGLLGGSGGYQQQQQPMQHAQANPQVFSSLMNPTDQVDVERRRQAQQMAVQGLLSGYGGRYG